MVSRDGYCGSIVHCVSCVSTGLGLPLGILIVVPCSGIDNGRSGGSQSKMKRQADSRFQPAFDYERNQCRCDASTHAIPPKVAEAW